MGEVVEMREWMFREMAGETAVKESETWKTRAERGGVK